MRDKNSGRTGSEKQAPTLPHTAEESVTAFHLATEEVGPLQAGVCDIEMSTPCLTCWRRRDMLSNIFLFERGLINLVAKILTR